MTDPDRPGRRMATMVGWQIALAVILFGGLIALVVWARSSGQSAGRVLVLAITAIVVLLAIFGAIVVVIGRRRRG